MNIILGRAQADLLKDKHLVLELDTITMGNSTPITAYCVVENVPLDQLVILDKLKQIHDTLMENYRNRRWDYCEQAIEKLVGAWNSQLDTFYSDLLNRVTVNKKQEPDESWTGIITKNSS